MSALSDALRLGRTRGILQVSALALALVLPGASWADHDGHPGAHDTDLAFADQAIDDDVLAQTHGAGQDDKAFVALDEDELGDDASSQSVNIGSLQTVARFGSHDAVAVSITVVGSPAGAAAISNQVLRQVNGAGD